eukprot:scaffold89477_cov27-Tisochrysis_lutea.AAC.4
MRERRRSWLLHLDSRANRFRLEAQLGTAAHMRQRLPRVQLVPPRGNGGHKGFAVVPTRGTLVDHLTGHGVFLVLDRLGSLATTARAAGLPRPREDGGAPVCAVGHGCVRRRATKSCR